MGQLPTPAAVASGEQGIVSPYAERGVWGGAQRAPGLPKIPLFPCGGGAASAARERKVSLEGLQPSKPPLPYSLHLRKVSYSDQKPGLSYGVVKSWKRSVISSVCLKRRHMSSRPYRLKVNSFWRMVALDICGSSAAYQIEAVPAKMFVHGFSDNGLC